MSFEVYILKYFFQGDLVCRKPQIVITFTILLMNLHDFYLVSCQTSMVELF